MSDLFPNHGPVDMETVPTQAGYEPLGRVL